MKKILILGGNSDIGIELVECLTQNENIEVHLHYRKNFLNKKKFKKCKLIKKDLNNINIKNLKNYFDNDYDIIVNLVGYVSKQSFADFQIDEIQKTILINSLIPFLIIRHSLKHMENKKFGRIINTSSVGVKFGGGLNTFSYSLSKHINEFIPIEMQKLCSKNVLYNTLRIGVTNTKFHKKVINKSVKKRIGLIPIKKMATTKDIAKYIKFLIYENNYVTNQIINITGGE